MTTVSVTNHSTTVTVTESAVVVTPSVETTDVTVVNGVDTFLGLSDTPNAYASQGGKAVAVKNDATGLEFVAFPTGGVTDHGALTGLLDDDHPQYHTDARGDARYWLLSTDLATQAELDAHVAAADPHPGYLTPAEGNALYWPLSTDLVTQVEGDAAYARLAAANTFALGPNQFRAGADGNVALAARRHSSGATGNIIEAQDESGATLVGVASGGNAFAKKHLLVGPNAADHAGYDAWINLENAAVSPRIAGQDVYGLNFSLTGAPGAELGYFSALQGFIDTGAIAESFSVAAGVFFAYHNASFDLPDMWGGYFSVENDSPNDVGAMRGIEAQMYQYGSGTIADVYGVKVGYADRGSGTWTNLYGAWIYNMAGIGTNNWALYTNGGAHRFGDYLDLAEISTPAAPSNTHTRLFARDNAGKTELCFRAATGSVIVIAAEP